MKKIPEHIGEWLSYDADSGELAWTQSRRAGWVGKPVRGLDKGYYSLFFEGKKYEAHRVAWFLHYGEQPPAVIDHINEVRNDNRAVNLRSASRSLNGLNSSKAKGYYLHKPRGTWAAKIGRKVLGYYKTPEEARAAYVEAKRAMI